MSSNSLSGRSSVGVFGVVIDGSPVEFDSESIVLRHRMLCDEDVKELLDALIEGKFTRLKTIDLLGNDLSDVSAERIARALKTNRTVTEVLLVSTPNLFVAAANPSTRACMLQNVQNVTHLFLLSRAT
jgi:DNA-binding transcriptional ArsR family regulator